MKAVTKPSVGKLSVSTKPLQKQRNNYLVSPTTGEKGRVLEPLNSKPEYHRKTAMTTENKYLTKIAEMIETDDALLPSISGYVGPTVLGTALGTIVPIAGNIVGGVVGYNWSKNNNIEVKDAYEKSLIEKGVSAEEARKLKEVLPVSYLGNVLAGAPIPVFMGLGAGGTYLANQGRRDSRQRIADRLEKRAYEIADRDAAILAGSGGLGGGLGGTVGETIRLTRVDNLARDMATAPARIEELSAKIRRHRDIWDPNPIDSLANHFREGSLINARKTLANGPLESALLDTTGSKLRHRGVGVLAGSGLGAYGAYKLLNNRGQGNE